MTRRRLELEAQDRLERQREEERAFDRRAMCLQLARQSARDPANPNEVLANAELMHRWLHNEALH